MKTKCHEFRNRTLSIKAFVCAMALPLTLFLNSSPAVSGSTNWHVHCQEQNPLRGCGCVNHDMASYNSAMVPPWQVLKRVSWEECGAWMNSKGFPGWEKFATNLGGLDNNDNAGDGKFLASFTAFSHGFKDTMALAVGKSYYIVARGTVNYSKPRNNRLINDACYEFNSKSYPVPMSILKSNHHINVCTQYNSNHTYRSAPFTATTGLQIWLYDTDYRDNSGRLTVDVYEVN